MTILSFPHFNSRFVHTKYTSNMAVRLYAQFSDDTSPHAVSVARSILAAFGDARMRNISKTNPIWLIGYDRISASRRSSTKIDVCALWRSLKAGLQLKILYWDVGGDFFFGGEVRKGVRVLWTLSVRSQTTHNTSFRSNRKYTQTAK